MTDPGTQSHVSGSAISTLTPSASDSSSTATITSWSETGMPAGLSFNTSTGAFSGTPTTACACSVTITAHDSAGYTGSATFTWNVTNVVAVTPQVTRSNTSGSAITPLTNSATDTQSGATLTWSATGLPAGLSIDAGTGTITGTPTTAGIYPVTVRATDSAGYSGSTSFSWTIVNTIT